MSEEYSEEEGEFQYSGRVSSFVPEENVPIEKVLNIWRALRDYMEDLGLPVLDSPDGGDALYDLLQWKTKHG